MFFCNVSHLGQATAAARAIILYCILFNIKPTSIENSDKCDALGIYCIFYLFIFIRISLFRYAGFCLTLLVIVSFYFQNIPLSDNQLEKHKLIYFWINYFLRIKTNTIHKPYFQFYFINSVICLDFMYLLNQQINQPNQYVKQQRNNMSSITFFF